MQGIYTYIPETNHVPREHCVAAILVLLFMVLISLVSALTLLLSLLLLLSSLSPLCRVSTLIFLTQTMSLENTVATILM